MWGQPPWLSSRAKLDDSGQIPCLTLVLPVFHNDVKGSPNRNRISPNNPQRENPRLARLLRELAAPAAPIPVTLLWTACTRLKIRQLQT
jgi:hypothetical protein